MIKEEKEGHERAIKRQKEREKKGDNDDIFF